METIEIHVIRRAQIFEEGADKGWFNINSMEPAFYFTKEKAVKAYQKFEKEYENVLKLKLVRIPAEGHFVEQYQIWYKENIRKLNY